MSDILNEPQFQVLTHVSTGEKTGRFYFPALFLAEFYQIVITWLKRSCISFDERDIKNYEDGSFRLYFKTTQSPKKEYLQLMKMVEVREIQKIKYPAV